MLKGLGRTSKEGNKKGWPFMHLKIKLQGLFQSIHIGMIKTLITIIQKKIVQRWVEENGNERELPFMYHSRLRNYSLQEF